MLELIKQIIDFYFKNLKEPSLEDLEIKDTSILEKKLPVFITIYHKWEITWSSGTINPSEENLALELIKNTIFAISKDSRFKKLSISDSKDIKIRYDLISSKTILQTGELVTLDPIKNGVIAIKRDYSNAALILPNISPKLLMWEDFIEALKFKLNDEKFKQEDYFLYKIETNSENDF